MSFSDYLTHQSRALLLAHSTTMYIHLNDAFDYDADDAELNNQDKPPPLRLVEVTIAATLNYYIYI